MAKAICAVCAGCCVDLVKDSVGFVAKTAFGLREVPEQEPLRPWPKLTGGKGLQVLE